MQRSLEQILEAARAKGRAIVIPPQSGEYAFQRALLRLAIDCQQVDRMGRTFIAESLATAERRGYLSATAELCIADLFDTVDEHFAAHGLDLDYLDNAQALVAYAI